ncbi:MAG: hypothetical protein LBR37_03590 [Erysipelotrichaceae bacterium]|nr:hypothetical protein [Erysipelotrichaceae bacterium]
MNFDGKNYIDRYIVSDIVGEFDDELYEHQDFDIATKILISSWSVAFDDDYDSCEAALGIALALWKYGVLKDEIKEFAFKIVSNKIKELEKVGNYKDIEYLNKKLDKLETPNPKPKKMPKYKGPFYRSDWKMGDVYAYHFTNTETNEKAYIYLAITGQSPMLKKSLPSAYVFDVVSERLMSLEEVKEKPFMIISNYPDPFEPEKTRGYSVILSASFDREVPYNKLTYLGNIGEVQPIENERRGAAMHSWESIDKDFTSTFKYRPLIADEESDNIH